MRAYHLYSKIREITESVGIENGSKIAIWIDTKSLFAKLLK